MQRRRLADVGVELANGGSRLEGTTGRQQVLARARHGAKIGEGSDGGSRSRCSSLEDKGRGLEVILGSAIAGALGAFGEVDGVDILGVVNIDSFGLAFSR